MKNDRERLKEEFQQKLKEQAKAAEVHDKREEYKSNDGFTGKFEEEEAKRIKNEESKKSLIIFRTRKGFL